jgi:NAD(P)-dependent dehydrogenase (short-subunit alcohol dehydrogenase family)
MQEGIKKVVLVTGASSGIGKSIADRLSAEGHTVYGASRSAAHLTKGVRPIVVDVTSEKSVDQAITKIISECGRLDVVINNAGLGMIGPVESISDEEVKMIFETNVFGVLNVCRQVSPLMRAQGSGCIINITSIAGLLGLPFRGIYSASKFAVEGLSESLSQELRPFGVKVCIVEPGDFKTGINAKRKTPAFIADAYKAHTAATVAQVNEEVNRARTPEPVAECILGIIADPQPRLRYKVATFTQRLSVWLKRLLPDRWFESMLMRYYRLRR